MKLRIDEPCHENWNAMTPNDQGAFCLSCQKNVIDFSTKSLGEIKSFFEKKPDTESVCGRFKKHQLEELSFDDFFRRFRRWNFLHRVAVICFFVFGLALFSCSPASEAPMGEVKSENLLPADTVRKQEPVVLPQDTVKKTTKKIPDLKKGEVAIDDPVIMQGAVELQLPDTNWRSHYVPKDSIKKVDDHEIMGKPARD